MIKRYISLNNLHLTTTVNIDGKEQSIIFKGGTLTPIRRNGIFTTTDIKLQKAIESDNGYGKTFIEIKDKILNTDSNNNKSKTPTYKSIKEIKNCQLAIEWINKNLSISIKNSSSPQEILKIANDHGYDFPNLIKNYKRNHDKK